MRRIIEFCCQEDEYFLQEDGVRIFIIRASDLKFNSLYFYTGVYKNKGSNIKLVNKIADDPHKKGDYIFSWLSDIVSAISDEFEK